MSRSTLNFICLLGASALLASSIASADVSALSKCPVANCPSPGFQAPQIDTSKALEGRLTALESKFAALEGKVAALEGNINKLMTHTHDVNTSIQNFSTFSVPDAYGKPRLVVQPVGNFGGTIGTAGQPKLK